MWLSSIFTDKKKMQLSGKQLGNSHRLGARDRDKSRLGEEPTTGAKNAPLRGDFS
jgi:hypothetical protein